MKLIPFFCCFFFGTFLVFSQIEEERLKVKRKYEVNVKNIEKKRTNPNVEEKPKTQTNINEPVDYQIVDVEATSNFEPSELPAQQVQNKFDSITYRHYVRAGYGNFNKLLAEGMFTYPLNKQTKVGLEFNHLSTSGLSKNIIPWQSGQARNEAEVSLYHNFKESDANFAVNFLNNKIHYYGVSDTRLVDENSDLQNRFNQISAKGFYNDFKNNYLDKIQVQAKHTSDRFKVAESEIKIDAFLVKKDVIQNLFSTDLNFGAEAEVNFNYITTKFNTFDTKFSNFNTGIAPILAFHLEKSFVKAGANIQYLKFKALENHNKLHIYPKVEINYFGISEFEIFGSLSGGLKTNSVSNFLEKNFFLFPNLEIKPTNTKYDVAGGIKGVFNETIKYKMFIGLEKTENLAFFNKTLIENNSNPLSYNRLNSFNVIYDNGNKLYFQAEGNIKPLENLEITGNFLFQKYKLDNREYAYNIPTFSADFSANYSLITEKLILGANLYFIGQRKTNDFEIQSIEANGTIISNEVTTNLKPYFDLNVNAIYRINPRLSMEIIYFQVNINLLFIIKFLDFKF